MKNNKLLVVNLQDPSKTQYYNPKKIGSFMWAKRLSNYRLFVLDQFGDLTLIPCTDSDVTLLQNIVNEYFS